MKSKINVKKNDAHLPPTIKRPSPNRNVVEPDSQDLGLDMIVNQKKKVVNNQDNPDFLEVFVKGYEDLFDVAKSNIVVKAEKKES